MKFLYNGRPIDRTEAVISAFDHGFLYGMGLFETFRTYGGEPWLLAEHAERLSKGCEALGIAYEPDVARMRDRVAVLLKENGLADGYIRWSVSAGEGDIGLPPEGYAGPNEVVYAKALPPDEPSSRKGKTIRLLKTPRSTPEGDVRLKSFHYMNNINGKRELIASGAGAGTEGLFLNREGRIVEGMVSNVFWIADGVLYTPEASTGLLEGITRAYVLDLATRLGIRTEQGSYGWDELLAADEAFLTNSIQEIVPVAKIENSEGSGHHPGGEGSVGPITSTLMREYRAEAERNER
ncbi:aminodeoxychorismate lyase [Cohnella suwonensis]|uniref:Aminodeoxychorismate lyase n=1 Tax=Cohnella suwonensis TaxID=696072 RepID=A0ABW0LRN3_9BACL